MSEVVIDALTNGLAHLPIRGAALRFAAMQQIAALSAAGYVIVPKEPTDAMINAAGRAYFSLDWSPNDPVDVPDIRQLLVKAIEAAKP